MTHTHSLSLSGPPSSVWTKPLLTPEHRRRRQAAAFFLKRNDFATIRWIVALDEATFYKKDPKDPIRKQKFHGKRADRHLGKYT